MIVSYVAILSRMKNFAVQSLSEHPASQVLQAVPLSVRTVSLCGAGFVGGGTRRTCSVIYQLRNAPQPPTLLSLFAIARWCCLRQTTRSRLLWLRPFICSLRSRRAGLLSLSALSPPCTPSCSPCRWHRSFASQTAQRVAICSFIVSAGEGGRVYLVHFLLLGCFA